ncbi:hypothetical protein ABTD28_20060, partial [Acinetobacter baumannii]
FQRLVGDPLIVLAPDAVYPLPPCHSLKLLVHDALIAGKSRTKNLRRYFAVQYTRSHVSVRRTKVSNPRLINKRSRTRWGAHVR